MRRGRTKLRKVVVGMMLLGPAMWAYGQRPGEAPPAPMGPPLSGEPRVESHQEMEMDKARNAMRQKKLVEQMEKLQQLTNELKAEVDRTDKEILSVEVIRKSEQIEKLARSIRELMRGPV